MDMHFCFLDPKRWGRFGCPGYPYHSGVGRVGFMSDKRYFAIALRRKDRFLKITNYRYGMDPKEYKYASKWIYYRKR